MKSRRGRKDARKLGRKYIQITWPLVKQGVPKNFNAQWFIIARGPCIVYLHYSASTSYVDYSLSLSLIPSLFIDSIEIALIPIWGVRRDAGYRCHFPSCTCENFLAFLQAHHLTMGQILQIVMNESLSVRYIVELEILYRIDSLALHRCSKFQDRRVVLS